MGTLPAGSDGPRPSPPDPWDHRRAVDPIALLAREHEVILERLRLIEVTLASPATEWRAAPVDRHTLLELLRFFTERVRIHFEREAALIAGLSLTWQEKPDGPRRGLGSFLEEHDALQADAERIAGSLEASDADAGPDVRAITSLIQRYRLHLDWEERILFVLAQSRLTAEEKTRIGGRMLDV